ncbi:MAG TPA: hypothetical protein VGI21_16260 [Streptosporangiaceae bacterium]|jgi:hypothetical protein
MAEPEGLEVLRTVWAATDQDATDLDEAFGPQGGHHGGRGKSCKNMRNVGFNGDDEDLREAWRGRLEREGKLARSGTLADLVFGVTSDAVAVQDPH